MFSGHGLEGGYGEIGPGQEIVDLTVRMAVDDSGDDVFGVGVGFDATQLTGLDQRSDDGPVLAAAIGAGEECVLAVERNRSARSCDDVAVDFDATIVKEAGQSFPARQGVADRLGKLGLLADQAELGAKPGFELIENGLAVLLPMRTSLIGAAGPGLGLDGVEFNDAFERRAGDRRGTVDRELIEAAADMSPTEGELHVAALGECAIAAIAIELQNAP